MHSLSQIHSQNEAAARQEHQALANAALRQGQSVIVYRDELGQPDLSLTPTVFPSQLDLDSYVNGNVPLHLQSRLDIHYGFKVLPTAPTVAQPTAAPAQPTAAQPTPSGHQSNGSGLQNHSIGGIFPRIAVHYPFTNTWRIREADGTESNDFSSYDEAYDYAEETATV